MHTLNDSEKYEDLGNYKKKHFENFNAAQKGIYSRRKLIISIRIVISFCERIIRKFTDYEIIIVR